MDLYFQNISTISGTSLYLFSQKHRYLFGSFQGLQRHSISCNISLHKIDVFFLSTIDDLFSFFGIYLTIESTRKKPINVMCTKYLEKIFKDAYFLPRIHNIKFYNEKYKDEFITVNNFNGNFYLKINKIKGKMKDNVNKLNIPKELRSKIKNREIFYYNNERIDGNDYLEDDIEVGDVYIVNKDIGEDYKYVKNVDIVFFREKKFYCEGNEFNFILRKNNSIDYNDHFHLQKKINILSKNYILPVSQKEEKVKNNYLCNQDKIMFNKESNKYVVSRCEMVKLYNDSVNNLTGNYILFLGTGAAIPSKYRNVSSFLYKSNDKIFLFDCGEDSLSQIKRAGIYDDFIKNLEFIFISHSHADHHLGLISILNIKNNIKIIGPKNLGTFLTRHKLLKNNFYFSTECDFLDFHEYKVHLAPVSHIGDSMGIKLIVDNFSISYSGDCEPSSNFASLSKKCNIMIHEATFSDDCLDNAIKTKHSTRSGAINIFKESEAEILILTHFSQRYPKGVCDTNILCALDFFVYKINEDNEIINQSEIYEILNEEK
ncbi:Ribonuclease Z [Spraguea lophii 42_110]|uniref:ribonuclease Z n=1 Tax=Spraguea lophii (strain 42_110) TaxID=1358809 RepID=S7XKM9_SPRLO|nr:Ribonuclease Z [Spraguea lophii 42_110]